MKLICGLVLIAVGAMCAVATDKAPKTPVSITISADSPTVKAGSDVSISVVLINNMDRDLDLSASINDNDRIDPNYLFEVRDNTGNLVPRKYSPLTTGHAVFRSLKPGDTLRDTQVVSRIFDMSRPGIYTVQGGRRISENEKDAVVKSNQVTITVTNK